MSGWDRQEGVPESAPVNRSIASRLSPARGSLVPVCLLLALACVSPVRAEQSYRPSRLSTGRIEIELWGCDEIERTGGHFLGQCRTAAVRAIGSDPVPPPAPGPEPEPTPPPSPEPPDPGPGPTPTPEPTPAPPPRPPAPPPALAQVPAWVWRSGREAVRRFAVPPLTWITVTSRFQPPALGCAHGIAGGAPLIAIESATSSAAAGILVRDDCSLYVSHGGGAPESGVLTVQAGRLRWVLQAPPGQLDLRVGWSPVPVRELDGAVIGPTEVRR